MANRILRRGTNWLIKHVLDPGVKRFGFDIVVSTPPDFSEDEMEIIRRVRPFTMSSPERIVTMIHAVRYVVENNVPGAIVECGVWRGGSIMIALLVLMKMGRTDRDVYLYDTFSGMTAPTEKDIVLDGRSAADLLKQETRKPSANIWAWATREDVTQNVLSTAYPKDRIHLVEGDVLKTIPATSPAQIALLRLDTDWYESTKHELLHLYPCLSRSGVLIIDDYGWWKGARKAVDEYFGEQPFRPLLHRIDFTGRCLIKV